MDKDRDCRCCEKKVPILDRKTCPECGHVFQGNGWDGIDAHWRSKHEHIMPYEEFWQSLCAEHRQTRGKQHYKWIES